MKSQSIPRTESQVSDIKVWSYSLGPYRAILTYNGSWIAEYFKDGAANPFFTSAHELHPNLKLQSNQFIGADRAVRRVLRSLERGWSVT
jgi:hypothetical protein